MSIEEKLNLLTEALDTDASKLGESTVLADLEEYDSLAKLSLIVMFDEQFGKKINAETVRQFVTVGDILMLMEQ